ncbi:unannotated protein [freshwater metagenome]|uniref:Unannotated protein n=1 Tax=freshwater metagenome TaxID=449393 RepID=A0A6J7LML5_9ZZZZ
MELAGAQPIPDRKVRSEFSAQGLDQKQCEACAVSQRAAEPIRTAIAERGQERTDEVPMCSMHVGHVDASILKPAPGGAKGRNRPVDVGGGHLPRSRHGPQYFAIHGGGCDRLTLRHECRRLTAAEVDFQGQAGAVFVNDIAGRSQPIKDGILMTANLVEVAHANRVDVGGLQLNEAGPALRTRLEVAEVALGQCAIAIRHPLLHRPSDDAVWQSHSPDGDGFKKAHAEVSDSGFDTRESNVSAAPARSQSECADC